MHVITNFVIFFYIMGLFFLKYPIMLVLFFCFALLLTLIFLVGKATIKKLVVVLLLNYFLWLISGFVMGGIEPKALLSTEFYEGDGRIFLYYLPLLSFLVFNTSRNNLLFLDRLFKLIALVSFFMLLAWNVHLGEFGDANDFFALFTSHTGAGTFFSALSLYFIVMSIESKTKSLLIFILVTLACLAATGSRQAVIALLFSLVLVYFRRLEIRYVAIASVLVVFSVIMLSSYESRMLDRFASLLSKDFVVGLPSVVDYANDWEVGDRKADEFSDNEAIVNAYNRILFWVKAGKEFMNSPIFGIGFGRYNDTGYYCEGGIACTSVASDDNVYSVANAHNSYLHILSENGVLGFLLMAYLWLSLYRKVSRLVIVKYSVLGRSMIVFVLINAMFGHALAAPTIGVITMTVIGVIYSLKVSAKETTY